MRGAILAVLAMIVVAAVPLRCEAQAFLNAAPDDPVNHAIDIIVASGLANDVIMGQRPFSRLEVARILKGAREKLDERRERLTGAGRDEPLGWKKFSRKLKEIRYLDKLVAYYEKQYARELAGMQGGVEFEALHELKLTQLYNGSKVRQIPVNNGEGSIDGIVTSFDQYDDGLNYTDGSNTFIETESNLYLTRYLAVSAQPRFEFQSQVDGDMQAFAHIHRLYLKTGISNFEFEIGRDNLLWGQGEWGGLMASSNPRPLDMIKLSNPYPLRIPYVGHMKWTFFVANLGPDRVSIDYPYFYGLKWSWRFSRWFEFGLSHTIMMGGDGATGVKWWEPIAELMPFHKWGGSNVGQADVANNAWGFLDWRLTIPPLRGSILYYDGYIEDSIVRAFRLPDNLLNQMAFIVGWYSPRLSRTGELGLRLEYHHTPPLAYRHGTWLSGYTLNRRVIGDAIGPDADAAYLTLYWRPRPTLQARVDLAFEDYDSSTYYTQTNAQGGGDKILKLRAGPHERRYRAVGAINWFGNSRYGIKFTAGYERIQNWAFNVGKSVNNAMVGAELTLHFDEFDIGTN